MSRRGVALDLPRTADGRPILSDDDLRVYDPMPRRSGGRDRYYCPIHGGDHQQSFSVDPDTGKYVCHTCKASGTLREFWPDAEGKRPSRRAAPPTVEEMGRRALERRAQADAERLEHLAGEIPSAARAFLARLESMQEALRDPGCPGAAYLRGRGLDPERAVTLGVGYAPPNAWPGDRDRRVGRLVYPLADPMSGRVVSAVGRLCIDPSLAWSDGLREQFKGAKQRKLPGCPAGIWPYASIAEARDRARPLVLVEGPADALALAQHPMMTYPVLGLIGTANVLPATSLRGVAGVVLALDDDEGGKKGMLQTRVDLALAGIRVVAAAPGWLGGAKDAGELADRAAAAAHDDGDDVETILAYDGAVQAVVEVCASIDPIRCEWDESRVGALLSSLYDRVAAALATVPKPWPAFDMERIDDALTARDWVSFVAAVDESERQYLMSITTGDSLDMDATLHIPVGYR